MKISLGWWRGSHNKATIPVGFDESLPQGFIEGLQWPDDIVLVGKDDSQMLSYEPTGYYAGSICDEANENPNQHTSDGKYYKLRVWKTETLTFGVENKNVL